ncbi:AAR054Cp [Eremothecium gossypii ATCC 10895]|uniref:AAR054Cp n=1 Tax=Eremothecium gossypii (strain ATCC 10895 / CBS 109.51 / FGSC 9923 / NRRL Y-1056) TaxID=284811 RepID=Q75EM5_EREGS|nr:AAR054Cp [Eremothecium gossypii ATCC 10895]AAS50419.1 AAR054Cp [Eremothecium gossypii ATCC 10895]AEY94705.1 FAAR054Cp [Eremothecium gossypii FDAG1]
MVAPARNSDHLRSKGNDLYSKGEYETAVLYYKNASLAEPSNPVHLANMSMALLKLERWEDALSACDRALEIMKKGPVTDDKILQKVQWRKKLAHEHLAGTERDIKSTAQNVEARYCAIPIEEFDDLPTELQEL